MLSAIIGTISFSLLPIYISLVMSLVNEGKLFTAIICSAGGYFIGSMIVLAVKQLTLA